MIFRVIVNRNDEIVGYKHRNDIVRGDIGRVSALWLENTHGEVLIAQRALTKRFSPGKWGPAVAGTVDEGEDYDLNIVKETKEELGIIVSLDELTKGVKEYIHGSHHDIFVQWYFLQKDILIEHCVYPEDEVAAIQYIPFSNLARWAHEQPEEFSAGFRSAVLRIETEGRKSVLGV